MNKSLATNLVAGGVFVVVYLSPDFFARTHIIQASLFALSGAITNWLAIHMLFEKVPGLYGSGIIPNRFEEFKAGIRSLIMDNFFTQENFERYFQKKSSSSVNVEEILGKLFDELVHVVKESSLGSMLGMFGGEAVLQPLKQPFVDKASDTIHESKVFQKVGDNAYSTLRPQVEAIIDHKLEELTPEMVKDIIHEMIRKHLGWLVVWGGVFGALIGIVCSLSLG